MHSQLSSRGHHRLIEQGETPEFLQGLRKINLLAGEELRVEATGRLEIFPGREEKRSRAKIRDGKVERGENVNKNAPPKWHRAIGGDARTAARATGRQGGPGARNMSG